MVASDERVKSIERVFMAIVAIIWFMLSVGLIFVNKPGIYVAGIPLLWFWTLVWIIITALTLTVAYYVLEVKYK